VLVQCGNVSILLEDRRVYLPYTRVPIVQLTRCTCNLILFILVKRSTCFGQFFVHHQELKTEYRTTVYIKHICLTYTVVVYAVLSSWWWAERPSETCRTFYKNK